MGITGEGKKPTKFLWWQEMGERSPATAAQFSSRQVSQSATTHDSLHKCESKRILAG